MNSIKNVIDRLCLDRIRNHPEPDIKEFQVSEKLMDYECIICLEEFCPDEHVCVIKCGHIYHTTCIYSWFLKKKTCPLCNEELKID